MNFIIVHIGSLEHILPIVITAIITFLLISYSKKQSIKIQYTIFKILGLSIFSVLCSYHLYRILQGNYNFSTQLPLYICSFSALVIPFFTHYRKFWMFEILVFWILGGTLQAVITPDITTNFPYFEYFSYWVVHLGLIVIILYAVSVLKMNPNFKSVFKSFLALQVYAAVIILINYILNANYCYLNRKPVSATLLDYFGKWPYYIFWVELLALPIFMLIYLPFFLSKKKLFSK